MKPRTTVTALMWGKSNEPSGPQSLLYKQIQHRHPLQQTISNGQKSTVRDPPRPQQTSP